MQRSLPKIIITTYTAAHKNMGVNQDEHNNYNGWFGLLRISEDRRERSKESLTT